MWFADKKLNNIFNMKPFVPFKVVEDNPEPGTVSTTYRFTEDGKLEKKDETTDEWKIYDDPVERENLNVSSKKGFSFNREREKRWLSGRNEEEKAKAVMPIIYMRVGKYIKNDDGEIEKFGHSEWERWMTTEGTEFTLDILEEMMKAFNKRKED